MAANIAYAGEKPVPDADDELALFERARKRALGEAFDLEASGRALKIRPATMSVASGDYGIYVRIGDRYTRIRVEVRW